MKAAGVAQLGEDRDCGQPPDPEDRIDQRAAALLLAGVGAQLLVKRDELEIERVDHAERDRDLLSGGDREL